MNHKELGGCAAIVAAFVLVGTISGMDFGWWSIPILGNEPSGLIFPKMKLSFLGEATWIVGIIVGIWGMITLKSTLD